MIFHDKARFTSLSVVIGICLVLSAITWVVFAPTLHADFINYDDPTYVYQEPRVTSGLSVQGITWAFTHFHSENWHPLTTISHMLDCQIYGLNPAGHHLTNVLLHTAAVVLLFLVLRQMTGAIWRSAFVAAVFAIHPLRVESVAWISERKDVLSAVFFMSILGIYTRYVREPSPKRYLLVALLFAFGLMSKPMLVTVPFILLLLDYWPLQRIVDLAALRKCLREKIPLLGVSVASCIVTIFAQKGTVSPLEKLPLLWRLENACATYLIYVWQMIWPVRLLPFYFHPGSHLSAWSIAVSVAFVVGMTALAFIARRRWPYLFTGWLWYVGMLVPVIGIVQVSMQARADRYTYLPQIGLYLLVTWGVVDLLSGWRNRRFILAVCATLVIGALLPVARAQVFYWRNSESLWTHAIALNPRDGLAEFSLGDFFLAHDRVEEAVGHLEKAISILPNYAPAHFQLAVALGGEGKVVTAIGEYRKVLSLGSDTLAVHYNLANALLQQAEVDEAISHYKAALKIYPDYGDAETNLANALLQKGEISEATSHYENALKLQPQKAEAHYNLAVAFHHQGRLPEAIAHYRKTLAIDPAYPDIHYYLGQALSQNGQPAEAAREFELQRTSPK
ncbi:MAG: protein O-mannosyl-transferase [Verrucomicrobiota bacterium]|jgi:Tfp pilus assembly protein PilF